MSDEKIKVGVVLSGCGFQDGAEIQESVLTLLAIMNSGAEHICFAPDIEQDHVTNHLTGENMEETRNVLVESARITRGNISPLSDFDPAKVDALVFPGGFGGAFNLSSFAKEGADCAVNEEVAKAVRGMVELNKPIGALCITPVFIAKLLEGAELTIGQDQATAEAIEKMGAKHHTTDHGEIVIDKKYKLVTTPCYMLDANVKLVDEGADKLIKAVLDMVGK